MMVAAFLAGSILGAAATSAIAVSGTVLLRALVVAGVACLAVATYRGLDGGQQGAWGLAAIGGVAGSILVWTVLLRGRIHS